MWAKNFARAISYVRRGAIRYRFSTAKPCSLRVARRPKFISILYAEHVFHDKCADVFPGTQLRRQIWLSDWSTKLNHLQESIAGYSPYKRAATYSHIFPPRRFSSRQIEKIINQVTRSLSPRTFEILPRNKYINIISTGAPPNLNFRWIYLNEIVLWNKTAECSPYKHVNSPLSRHSLSLADLNFRLMSVEIKSNFEIKRNVKYSYTGARDIFVSTWNQLARVANVGHHGRLASSRLAGKIFFRRLRSYVEFVRVTARAGCPLEIEEKCTQWKEAGICD